MRYNKNARIISHKMRLFILTSFSVMVKFSKYVFLITNDVIIIIGAKNNNRWINIPK